jgi:ribonuclease J
MNLNAYGYGPPEARQWIIVDIGVTFGGVMTPGVELILPDPTFLEERKDDILAIVLTHAHEDHIGAIAHLWPRLKAPVYATPFTAYLVREKLKEAGLDTRVKLHEIALGGQLRLGPFEIDLVTLTHSIPEPNGLAIRTPLGLVWHTGDWKIDPDPLIGATTDSARVKALGDGGVLAMVCDSTNVFVEGAAGSEADVRDALTKLVATKKGRVAVTAFASNVARVETAIKAAQACGRRVCLVGRSMHRIVGAARSVGLLSDAPAFVTEEQAARLDDGEVLYLCTGSQGEPRAALSRIASGDHRHVRLGKGDCVIFSSRIIPGNEASIFALYNALVEREVEVITDRDWPIHVSGHPARDELKEMYQWARPRIAVPVHGERRHLLEHAALARELQVSETIAPRNGDIIKLAPGKATIIDEAPAGRLYLDGAVLTEADSEGLKERRRLSAEGHVSIALAVSGKRHAITSGPDVRCRGISFADEEDKDDLLDACARMAETAYHKLSAEDRADADEVEQALAKSVRKGVERLIGKRPFVDVLVLEV